MADDTDAPPKPDALFPNNWVSFHLDGTVVLYPMLAPNRRSERREEVIRQVTGDGRYRITRTVDLSHRESEGKYLEGTGSLVLDRVRRVAYANLSPRTDLDVLGEFAQQLDYELVTFEAFDGMGRAVYHTNVLMVDRRRFRGGLRRGHPASARIATPSIPNCGHRGTKSSRYRSRRWRASRATCWSSPLRARA